MHEGTSKKVPEYWGKGQEKKRKKFTFDKKPSKTEKDKEEIKRLQKEYEKYDPSKATAFKKMPLSWKTLSALKTSGFLTPTEIQRESIGLALRGLDILGAAKTGSGKTLAFLIPILEALNSKLWTKLDGLGALIITPTRELAYQIFEALKKVGAKHDFSAGLIIGGKDLKFERKRMDQLNIVICTPGRLLQHMDENPNFDCSNLQILVLDEADRCLDMGFETTMNAIIANLPKERQTLLFSATQTKSVRDLARLSLKSPVYVSVHENAQYSTPESLQQSYVVCPLEMKLDMLWSFLKHHKKAKILVFLSSCKQVRFVHMLFCRMRPGVSLLALYGTMHQLKRMAVYEEFCSKQSVVLFATDIASRGLDFPAVDWVLQVDCPEDATTYIHRAGRTARFNKDGEALLVLLPSEEEAMITELTEKKIPIEKIDVNNKKMTSVKRKFEALLARDVTLKECAQRAFKAYLKSYFMMKNKKVFDVNQLELTSFAGSLGLAVAPRVRFLQKRLKKSLKPDANAPKADNESQSEEESQEEDGESDTEVVVQNLKSEATGSYDFDIDGDDDNVDDLFVGKKEVILEDDNEIDAAAKKLLDGMNPGQKKNKVKSKIAIAKKALKKNMLPNKKIVFDEEGGTVTDIRRERQSEMAKEYETENAGGIDIEKAKQILKLEDQVDKKIHRERIKAKHKEKKKKVKLAQKGEEEEEVDTFDATAEMDGEASDDDGEPDLSWLPDPDKVYGETDGANDKDVEDDDVGSNDSDEEEEVPALGKRKARQVLDPDDSDAEYAGLIVNTSDESDSDDNPKTIRHKMMQLSKSKNSKNAKRKKLDKLDKTAMEEFALQLLKQ